MVGLLLAALPLVAIEPLGVEPRLVGDVDAGRLCVEDATAVGDDLAFLGTHGRERLSLRWFDADRERERKLQTEWSGEMPRELAAARDGIIFTGHRERQGTEPWRSDGTRARTKLIREIHTGRQSGICAPPGGDCPTFPAGSDPQSFVTIGRTTFFAANHPTYGKELWRRDGTRQGTRLVRDIRSGPKTSEPRELTAVGDMIYFTADDRKHGRELWRTDGTRAGTALVADLRPGPDSSAPTDLVALGHILYLTNWDLSDELSRLGELWHTTGSTAGFEPVLLEGDGVGRKWSEFPTFAANDERLFLTADDGVHGNELWVIESATGAPALVADVHPGPMGSDPEWLTLADSSLYFTAVDTEHGRQLWALPLEAPTAS